MSFLSDRTASGRLTVPFVFCLAFGFGHVDFVWGQGTDGTRPQVAKNLQTLQEAAMKFRHQGDWPKAVARLNELSKKARKSRRVEVAFNAEMQVLEIAGSCGDKPSTPDNWIRKSTQDAISLMGKSKNLQMRLEGKLEECRDAIQNLPKGRSPELCEKNLATIEEALATLNNSRDAFQITRAVNRSKSEFRANLIEHIMKTSGKKGVAVYDLVRRHASLVASLNQQEAVISEEASLKVKRYVASLAEIDQPRADYYQIVEHANQVMKSIDRDAAKHQGFCRYFLSRLQPVMKQHVANGELSLAQNYALSAFRLAKWAYADDPESYAEWLTLFVNLSDNLLGWEDAANDLLVVLQQSHANSDLRVIAVATQLIQWKKVRGKFDLEQCQEVLGWISKAGDQAEEYALDCEVFLCDHFVAHRNIDASRKHLNIAIALAKRIAPENLAELQYRVALLELGSDRDRARQLFQEIIAGAKPPYNYCQAESAHRLAKLQSQSEEMQTACDSMSLSIKMFEDVYNEHPELLRVTAIYSDGDGTLQQTVDPVAEAEVNAQINRFMTLASWQAEISSREATATLRNCLQFIHQAQRFFAIEESVRSSIGFSFLVERQHAVLQSIVSAQDGAAAVPPQLVAELKLVKKQLQNYQRSKQLKTEMAIADAQDAVRDYQHQMINSPIGMWGIIRFVEVSAAGLPTGRIK